MPRLTALSCALVLCGCSSLPGRDYPRQPSPLAAEPPNPRRFEHMTQPQNAYAVRLEEKVLGDAPGITWNTVESGHPVTLYHEPARSSWQKFELQFLELFPIDWEL